MPYPQLISGPPTLSNLISSAVAPVALISTTAILLSGYTAKYGGLASQLRGLTNEYRRADISEQRQENIRRQLVLFHKRVTAIWFVSIALSYALVAFFLTVLSVIFVQHSARLGLVGSVTLVIGILFMVAAVGADLYEIHLARLTIAGELSDIFHPH